MWRCSGGRSHGRSAVEEANFLQPRSRGFPHGVTRPGVLRPGHEALEVPSPFQRAYVPGFSRDAKAVNSKHAGSALIVNVARRTSAKSAGLLTLRASRLTTAG